MEKKNKLSDVYPEVAKEWNYEKNFPLTPEDVTYGSNQKVWWKCNYPHEWYTSISSRCVRKRGCPYCSGQRVSKENCVASIFPKLINEWDCVKNGKLTPNDVTPSSNKKVWWKCKNGHEWIAAVFNRTRGGECPYCKNRKVCKDNCLQTSFPEISKEWDYEANYPLTPNDVFKVSNKKFHWVCKNKHKWVAAINDRTGKSSRCPICSKIKLKDGFVCDSLIEAWYYLSLVKQKIQFVYNKRYPNSKSRFDFYIPSENKFVELTSYDKKNYYGNEKRKNNYMFYLRKIVRKRKLVRNIGANFEFIQKTLTKDEKTLINKFILR